MRKGMIAALLIVIFVQPPQPVEAGAFATEVTNFSTTGSSLSSTCDRASNSRTKSKCWRICSAT